MRWFWSFLLIWPLLGACAPFESIASSSVRPVVKIGLLGSFEGLHRQNGYAALTAMRLALDTYQGHEMAIMPLALHIDLAGEDNGARAIRTVQKLLADPDVKAVVGPYDPRLIAQISPVMAAARVPWFLPLMPDPTQVDPVSVFVRQDVDKQWAISLVQDVTKQAAAQGAERLILSGWQPGWPVPATLLEIPTTLPLVVLPSLTDDITEITSADALFWLGRPEMGARYLANVYQRQPGIPIWFGPTGGDPILPKLVPHGTPFDSNKLYWVTWLDDLSLVGANQTEAALPTDTEVSVTSPPLAPTTYLTYRATQAAIATLDRTYVLPTQNWRVVHFALQTDGTSQRWN